MRFFNRKMMENAGKFVSSVITSVNKNTQKTPIVKTSCGKTVDPDGEISMFGTVPGSMKCSVSRHDNASKIKAYKDVEEITKAGGIPQIDITWDADSSRYASDGIIVHRYTWRTKDIRAEIQEDPNNAPHV